MSTTETTLSTILTDGIIALRRETQYAAIIAELGDKVTLIYAGYDDYFDAEQLDAMIHGNDEDVMERLSEWESDARFYGVTYEIDNLSPDLRDAVRDDDVLYEMVQEYLWEHDDSTWWDDMVRNSRNQLFLYRIGTCEGDDERAEIIDALSYTGIEASDANLTAIDSILAEHTYGGTVYFMWYGPADDFVKAAWSDKARTLTFTDPTLLVYNHFNGAGMEAKLTGTAKVGYNRDKIHIDGHGPGYSADECFGFYLPAFSSNDPKLTLDNPTTEG